MNIRSTLLALATLPLFLLAGPAAAQPALGPPVGPVGQAQLGSLAGQPAASFGWMRRAGARIGGFVDSRISRGAQYSLVVPFTPWQPNHAYGTAGVNVTNNGLQYTVATTGTSAAATGPTGATAGIVDGTVTWNYVTTAPTYINAADYANDVIGWAVRLSDGYLTRPAALGYGPVAGTLLPSKAYPFLGMGGVNYHAGTTTIGFSALNTTGGCTNNGQASDLPVLTPTVVNGAVTAIAVTSPGTQGLTTCAQQMALTASDTNATPIVAAWVASTPYPTVGALVTASGNEYALDTPGTSGATTPVGVTKAAGSVTDGGTTAWHYVMPVAFSGWALVTPGGSWAGSGEDTQQAITQLAQLCADGNQIEVVSAGANDFFNAIPYAQEVANLQILFDGLQKCGKLVEAISVSPRLWTASPAAASNGQIAADNWQADYGRSLAYANSNGLTSFLYIPTGPLWTDGTSATGGWTTISGGVNPTGGPNGSPDGQHQGEGNAFTGGMLIWQAAQQALHAPLAHVGSINQADTYDATYNPFGTINPNSTLQAVGGVNGAAGCATTGSGATLSVPASFTTGQTNNFAQQGTQWLASHAYATVGTLVFTGGNTYSLDTAGASGATAPTGQSATAGGTTDGGTTAWHYIAAGSCTLSFDTSQGDGLTHNRFVFGFSNGGVTTGGSNQLRFKIYPTTSPAVGGANPIQVGDRLRVSIDVEVTGSANMNQLFLTLQCQDTNGQVSAASQDGQDTQLGNYTQDYFYPSTDLHRGMNAATPFRMSTMPGSFVVPSNCTKVASNFYVGWDATQAGAAGTVKIYNFNISKEPGAT